MKRIILIAAGIVLIVAGIVMAAGFTMNGCMDDGCAQHVSYNVLWPGGTDKVLWPGTTDKVMWP
jgi:hypothetical protein